MRDVHVALGSCNAHHLPYERMGPPQFRVERRDMKPDVSVEDRRRAAGAGAKGVERSGLGRDRAVAWERDSDGQRVKTIVFPLRSLKAAELDALAIGKFERMLANTRGPVSENMAHGSAGNTPYDRRGVISDAQLER